MLLIETATSICSVALSFGDELVAFKESNVPNSHSAMLNVLIDELLKENGVSYGDIVAVALSIGPGSYTGLRIGSSTAKGLAYALSGPEVPGFHVLLGIFHGVAENLGVDGRVLVHAEGVHHVHDALRAEQTHDVVLQREEEARLAGVALTAGTAAELIVDTAGFVALRADDEQTAGGADTLGLGVDVDLVAGEALLEGGADGEDLGVGGLGVGVGLGDQLVGKALLAQVGQRHVFGVAAEHDVRATACHVGRDRDRAELTRLRDDLCLALVVLGVQHGVRHAFALEHF